ncbi:hypothetical protein [Chitinophaga flava]|uniref:Uncharacterized protein n=1 Tax=Chitinophaga flava TaxID=2259036 RepID=A0A365XWJ7_9BACT|nr:hypothetical protein [Chitinophaga flava]RBL90074.1 hypothetical protein DF182_26750 [Chitinophaga flava]
METDKQITTDNMSKTTLDSIKAFCCLVPLILLVRMTDSIPWWSFVVVVGFFGAFISIRKWSVAAFGTGFLAGMLVWVAANIYFHIALGGSVFNRIGLTLSVPGPVVILISGIIGGLLTGLALFTGKAAIKRGDA